jgi:D-tyrosyl-tRNA(Tyr) deacylase
MTTSTSTWARGAAGANPETFEPAAASCHESPVRAVVQRVSRAEVRVDGQVTGSIGRGLAVLLGVWKEDGEDDARLLADKLAALRIFEDDAGKMNLALAEVGGGVLVVSQFTLLGDVRKGNRPSFTEAAPPEAANALYERFCALLREKGLPVGTGVFRASMEVELVNDGPVTILLDSRKLF